MKLQKIKKKTNGIMKIRENHNESYHSRDKIKQKKVNYLI